MPNAMPHDKVTQIQINPQSDQYADKKVHLPIRANANVRVLFLSYAKFGTFTSLKK